MVFFLNSKDARSIEHDALILCVGLLECTNSESRLHGTVPGINNNGWFCGRKAISGP